MVGFVKVVNFIQEGDLRLNFPRFPEIYLDDVDVDSTSSQADSPCSGGHRNPRISKHRHYGTSLVLTPCTITNPSKAPTVPKKRPSIRTTTKASTSSSAAPTTSTLARRRAEAVTTDNFISSKRDKRIIKSNSFLSRIEKNANKKPLKRRRPNKKLVANLESLADALPDVDELPKAGDGEMGKRVKMTSLTSGKGLMKRRAKVEGKERERFGKNMGVLMAARDVKGEGMDVEGEEKKTVSSTASRFAALRNWIGETMEKEKAFEGNET